MQAQGQFNFAPPPAGVEDGPGPQNHPKVLENETPSSLIEAYTYVVYILSHYGWFLLGGVILAWYLKSKLEHKYHSLRQKYEDQTYLNTDPEIARRRQEEMERARRRMQEEHDAKAALAMEAQIKREEQKRKERIEDWERHQHGGGYRSKVKTQEEESSTSAIPKRKPTTYRSDDYNPMMGGGSGSTYRPTRRGGGGRGG